MKFLDEFKDYFVEKYSNFPVSRYISILLVRETQSETIFRTEGSGAGVSKEFIKLAPNEEVVQRVVITKRKQVAVERRTGRELLRSHGLLHAAEKDEECALNRNNPCEKCIDCMLYGYAVGGGGAQRSRVMTHDAYSLLPAADVTAKRTFNALFDNGTMRDPVTNKASTSIGETEYVKPGTHFIDLETLKDVTAEEFVYVLGNILRSKRYGAISSKIGRVENHILALVFSDCELASNLEILNETLKKLGNFEELSPDTEKVKTATVQAFEEIAGRVAGRVEVVRGEKLIQIIENVRGIYREPAKVGELLAGAESKYPD